MPPHIITDLISDDYAYHVLRSQNDINNNDENEQMDDIESKKEEKNLRKMNNEGKKNHKTEIQVNGATEKWWERDGDVEQKKKSKT